MLTVRHRPQPLTLNVALLRQPHVLGLWSLIPSGFFKLDSVVLLERRGTRAYDGRVVDEYIFAPIGWADESEPFRTVEPLYRSLHNYSVLCLAQRSQGELKQTFAS